MAFEKNSVFRDANGQVHRILWAHGSEEMVWVIDIYDRYAWPKIHSRSDLVDAFVKGELKMVEDPVIKSLPRDEELTEAERSVRDRAWDLIGTVVKVEPDIYTPQSRAKLVKQAGGTRQTCYKHIRRYWQRGNVPNALVPDYENCGAKGKPRAISGRKRGRPRSISPGNGINVTDDVLKLMRTAYSRICERSRKATLKTAYDWLLGNCFPEAVKIITSETGRNLVKIDEPDLIPTFEQFSYHINKENNLAAKLIKRKGLRVVEKEMRPLLSSSLNEVYGPGTRYQIDATIIDVYIVSRYDRNKIVGRPTLYLVVDVFSRMIVGCYVGLDAPSWVTAVMALLNVVEDKVQFCAKYGIPIEPDEWPVAEFPLKLLGDRGEMESKMADRLVSAFGIDLENAAPYRGDAKGVVERSFNTMHATFGPYTPGFVDTDFRERGAHDYRLDAVLTIEEITKIVILSILEINKKTRKGYKTLPEAVKDNIPYASIDLWNWGKENLRADTRPFTYEYAKQYLLPDDDITVTRKGLRFMRGLYYYSEAMMAEPWYLDAQVKKEILKASYHPGDMTRIWISSPYDRTRTYTAELVRHCDDFRGMSLVEIDALRRRERQIKANNKITEQEFRISTQRDIEIIIDYAIKQAKEDFDPTLSNSQRVKGIGGNREKEFRETLKRTVAELGIGEFNAPLDESNDLGNDEDDIQDQAFLKQARQRRAGRGE
jgi:hypothetical protein